MRLRERAETFIFKETRVLANLSNGRYVVFPGGGVDKSETPIEAAKRECREEAARRLINLTPAHPPTVQIWPEGFTKDKWAKDFQGGYTYWFTGSSSDDADNQRHKDYEPGFKFYPIKDVLAKLKLELSGSWAEDVKVRMAVLETHLAAARPVKDAAAKTAVRVQSMTLPTSVSDIPFRLRARI
jgi:8-oxo-dGTP pyrophosphatase MutT (NUDIX family)